MTHLQQAFADWTALGNGAGQATALDAMALVETERGEYERAIRKPDLLG